MVSLVFTDSFAHYNDTSLKWSSGGGTFNTNPAHIRTGPQSLQINSVNSPFLNLALFTSKFNLSTKFVFGVAWQTTVLNGEVIFQGNKEGGFMTPQVQLSLVQNADGSISLWNGLPSGGTLLGTSVTGVLTLNTFWYIELTADLGAGNVYVVVTNTSTNVASTVITVSGVVTSQGSVDTFRWGGPAFPNSAWLSDFYVACWDGTTGTGFVEGAPKIYGLIPPVSDGLDNNWSAQGDGGFSPPPLFSLVDTIPQQTGTFMFMIDTTGLKSGSQTFNFNPGSVVPSGSSIAGIQACLYTSLISGDQALGRLGYLSAIIETGNPDVEESTISGITTVNVVAAGTLPYRFYCSAVDLNPFTSAAFTLAEFLGGSALQFGPKILAGG
jgi:hypothetical protein